MIDYKTISLANQVYNKLEMAILSGEYKTGEVITEKRLAEELGVSRTPIREAFAALAQANLIGESSKGTIVLGITQKDLEDIFEVKRRLEIMTATWVVDNIDDEGIAKLKEILEQQEFYAGKGDSEKVRNFDTEFHAIMYANCGSKVMENILTPLHRKMLKYRKVSLENPERIKKAIEEHKGIYNAIASRDKKMVEELMTIHIENARKSILERKA